MQVADMMRKIVITTTADRSLAQAQQRLQEHRVRHLPVVAQTHLIGLLTDRDVRQASLAPSPTRRCDPRNEQRPIDAGCRWSGPPSASVDLGAHPPAANRRRMCRRRSRVDKIASRPSSGHLACRHSERMPLNYSRNSLAYCIRESHDAFHYNLKLYLYDRRD